MSKKRTRRVVTPDKVENQMLIAAIESQGNVIPPAIATVMRLAAPLITRLAIRYVARRYRKHISDTAVNTASAWMGEKVQGIIDRSATK